MQRDQDQKIDWGSGGSQIKEPMDFTKYRKDYDEVDEVPAGEKIQGQLNRLMSRNDELVNTLQRLRPQ